MKSWLKICVMILFMVAMPLAASAAPSRFAKNQCKKEARTNPPKIEVVYNYGELKIDHTHTAEELAEIMKKMYPSAPENNHKINGLTRLSPYISVESGVVEKQMGENLCYYPESVKLYIGYKPVVYIREDLPEGTCRYNVTMRHEQTHLDIGDLSMQQFLQKIQVIFPRIVKEAGVVIKSADDNVNAVDASTELNDLYHKRVSGRFDVFVSEMVNQQIRIDTTDSYDFEGSLCPQELQQ